MTQGQYRAVMGVNPAYFKGAPNLPVESVSWEEAMQFCRRLTGKVRQPSPAVESNDSRGRLSYILPTEAQWEYACRAGTTTRYSFGDDEKRLADHAWYDGNSDGKPHPVRTKHPNPWGLYEMHGNVWEWCLDWVEKYPGKPVVDLTGDLSGSVRAFRGGGWGLSPGDCRSAARLAGLPAFRYRYLGFRLAAPAAAKRSDRMATDSHR